MQPISIEKPNVSRAEVVLFTILENQSAIKEDIAVAKKHSADTREQWANGSNWGASHADQGSVNDTDSHPQPQTNNIPVPPEPKKSDSVQ